MLAPTTKLIGQTDSGQAELDRRDPWDDEQEARKWPSPLTRNEAQALVAAHPSISPWSVVAVQAGVGLVVALLGLAVMGQGTVFWSALYGAGVVVLPGALMARGMTSRFSRMSPGVGASSFMLWEAVKMVVSLAMLALASKLVQPLSWPALLVGMVLCMKVYWIALSWRGRKTSA